MVSRCPRATFVAILFLGLIGLNQAAVAWGKNADAAHVAVIVSLKIRPYLDALQGMEEQFADTSGVQLGVHFLDPDADADNRRLTARIKETNIGLAVAIGPEAMHYLWMEFPSRDVKKIFAMVLDPEKVVPQATAHCGIPLNIPAAKQILEFREKLPTLKRIGLLYHPANNQPFADAAAAAAAVNGLDMVHLKVGNLNDMPSILNNHWRTIQALWMIPDRAVISESLIPYVVKAAIANDVAVIGYNRFFTESGAALALVRNYHAIGQQAATMAVTLLAAQPCQMEVPTYEVLLNIRVLDAVGLAYAVDKKPTVGEDQP